MNFLRQSVHALCQTVKQLPHRWTKPNNDALVLNTVLYPVLGERHLHQTVKEYVYYFNHARPHQGIAQSIPCLPELPPHSGKVVSHPVLGGLHHDYRRQAA